MFRNPTIPARSLLVRSASPLQLRAVLAVLTLALPAVAAANAGQLAPGDSQLASGEYYDRVTFEAVAGDSVVIEISSTAFDPYLILLDPSEQVVLEMDDSAGAGLNVLETVRLTTAGTYTIVVTSARPGEAGAYRVAISAASGGGAAAGPGKSGVPAQAPAQAPTQPPAQVPTQTPPAPASPSPTNTEPGTVTGTVVDTMGRPIAGARVWIQPAITTGLVEVRTDAQGRYRVPGLIDEPYNAKAWAYVEYGGRQLCLRLGMESPVDYDAFVPSHGAVRNFRWQLTGPIEDMRGLNEYFGGMLRVMNTNAYAGSGNRIELSFTPTGPRIDGSSVAPFTRTIDPSRDYDVYDLPAGPYRVTAVLVTGNGARQELRLGPDIFDTARDALDIDWSGDGTCSNANGLDWAYAWLNTP